MRPPRVGGAFQRVHDDLNDTTAIFQYFMVGETQHDVTLRLQPLCSYRIAHRLLVATVLIAV